jgi:tRNA(fMet)-specific endonuclease VapC
VELSLYFLLDTNIISELARETPNPNVEQCLRAEELTCAIAAPSLEELAYGVGRLPVSRKRDRLEKWLEGVTTSFPVLLFDARAALWLGRERARLSAIGQQPPKTDGEIAAIAVCNGLTLVTRNIGDFRAFGKLKLENWFS